MWFPKCFSKHWFPPLVHHFGVRLHCNTEGGLWKGGDMSRPIWILGNDLNMVTSHLMSPVTFSRHVFQRQNCHDPFMKATSSFHSIEDSSSTPFRNKRQSTTKTRRTRRCHVDRLWQVNKFPLGNAEIQLRLVHHSRISMDFMISNPSNHEQNPSMIFNDLKSTENLCIVISCDRRIWCLVQLSSLLQDMPQTNPDTEGTESSKDSSVAWQQLQFCRWCKFKVFFLCHHWKNHERFVRIIIQNYHPKHRDHNFN